MVAAFTAFASWLTEADMDSRTRKNIETLHPNARPWAVAHLDAIRKSGLLPKGWEVRIISGNRTWAEQDALYARGRPGGPPGSSIVTYAKGGQSNHNFGIAWDLGLFDERGKYVTAREPYVRIAEVGKKLGLEWGGDWKMGDTPHYQIPVGLSIRELRGLVLKGKEVPVPTFGDRPAKKEETDRIAIYDGQTATDIPAFLSAGRVWVAVRPFVERFGGEVESVNGANFVLALHEKKISLAGTIRDGVGYAKVADINRVLDWDLSFEADRLTIVTGAA